MAVLSKNGTGDQVCVLWSVSKDTTYYNRIVISIEEVVASGVPNTESATIEVGCDVSLYIFLVPRVEVSPLKIAKICKNCGECE